LFYLDQLNIECFRNYKRQNVHFHPGLNIITGDNAQGKTNLLESIFFLSVNRSFRTRNDKELARYDGAFFNLKGIFVKDEFNHIIQVGYRHNQRLIIKVNNDQAHRYDHIQNYPVIAFCPDDLQIINAGPSVRRRFLNLVASRLDPVYLKQLRDYQRVLNHRNQVLKNYKNRSRIDEYLAPWDQALIVLGVGLVRTRIEMIKAMENEASYFFSAMTGSEEEISLKYASSIKYCPESREMEKQFSLKLMEKREQELRRCSTLLGPHLDDMVVMINGLNTRNYSSQGQKRTAALALKMGEVSLFKQQHELHPIILLDDVFSEFDSVRKRHLLDFLRKNSGQCFITSALDLSDMVNELNRSYKHITIRRGNLYDETIRTGD